MPSDKQERILREQAKWSPAELEYRRIDDAIRNYMNFASFRNPNSVIEDPTCLYKYTELLSDIWDQFRAYFKDDKRREDLDGRLDVMRSITARLHEELCVRQGDESGFELQPNELDEINGLFKSGREVFHDIMDLRHERGMGIGTHKERNFSEEAKKILEDGGERHGRWADKQK
jgi:hypothetical protein